MITLNEHVPECPLCGQDPARSVAGKSASSLLPDPLYFICESCGVKWLSPRMDENTSLKFYEGEYREILPKVSRYTFERDLGKQAVRANKLHGLINGWAPASHLDYGCSLGVLLEKLMSVNSLSVGIELNRKEREYCWKKGMTVYKDLTELHDEKFELITVIHVLEHVNHPGKLMSDLAARMAKNGKILIEVPDGSKVDDWTPWHVISFTQGALVRLVESCGLKVILAKAEVKSLYLIATL